jgi:hypothetical protein
MPPQCDVSILYAQNILRLDQADLQRLKHQKPSFKCRVEGKANRIQVRRITEADPTPASYS